MGLKAGTTTPGLWPPCLVASASFIKFFCFQLLPQQPFFFPIVDTGTPGHCAFLSLPRPDACPYTIPRTMAAGPTPPLPLSCQPIFPAKPQLLWYSCADHGTKETSTLASPSLPSVQSTLLVCEVQMCVWPSSDMVLLYSPAWPGTCCVAFSESKSWDYRSVPLPLPDEYSFHPYPSAQASCSFLHTASGSSPRRAIVPSPFQS